MPRSIHSWCGAKLAQQMRTHALGRRINPRQKVLGLRERAAVSCRLAQAAQDDVAHRLWESMPHWLVLSSFTRAVDRREELLDLLRDHYHLVVGHVRENRQR